MSSLEAKREEIAALIAKDLGLGDLAALQPEERVRIDSETARVIEAQGPAITDDGDPVLANVKLRRLLSEYRDLAALKADERDTRLAEQGEVFSREDDA